MKAVEEPLHLFITREVIIVEQQRVRSLTQRRLLAGGVDTVALAHIGKNLVIVYFHTLGTQLIYTPLRLTSGDAFTNTFISASGNTAVPMSRPSITIPLSRPYPCCSATRR